MGFAVEAELTEGVSARMGEMSPLRWILIPARTPSWRQVGTFVALTFALTWLLNLAIFLRGGWPAPGLS